MALVSGCGHSYSLEKMRKTIHTSMQNIENIITLENARHCEASLTKYTPRTWSSYMHLTVNRITRMWLNLRPQKITKYTHVYTGTVSQQVVEMAWTDDSTLAIFF